MLGDVSGRSTLARTRSRARVRMVMAPKSVPLAAMPGVDAAARSATFPPTTPRSRPKRIADTPITIACTAVMKTPTPIAFPAKMALRESGGSLRRAPVVVVEARNREGLEARLIACVLRALLGLEDRRDELRARAELLLHLAERRMEAEQLRVRDAGEAFVAAAIFVRA